MALADIFSQLANVSPSATQPAGVNSANVFSGNRPEGVNPDARKGSELYRTLSPFGSAELSKFGVNATGTPEQQMFADLFASLGQNFLGQAQGAQVQGTGALPFDLSALLAGFGGDANTAKLAAAGGGFTDIASQLGSAFQGFNVDDFASQQFARLQNIAGPAEATAANNLADRLFSRGRLGGNDTTAGRAFGELHQAQSAARDQRALDALGLGFTQQSQLGSLSQLFGNLGSGMALGGSQLAGSNLANILSSAGGIRGDQAAQNSALQLLLNFGSGAMQGNQSAFAPLQQAIANAFLTKDSAMADRQLRAATDAKNQNAGASAIGTIGGAIIGGIYGGPAGAKVGASAGGSLGGMFG